MPPHAPSHHEEELTMELPPDAISVPMPDVIDSNEFTPRLILLLNNSLVWRESRIMRARFGLGTNDWRVISALATRPGATASEISDFLGMNKAIISKSVGVLTERRLIVQVEDTGRSRQLFLTPEGAEMHDGMLPISLRGQEIVLGDLTDEEVTQLNGLLHRLLARTPELQADYLLDEREASKDAADV
jgi:DNA-binding MarR family transcriptional regulator